MVMGSLAPKICGSGATREGYGDEKIQNKKSNINSVQKIKSGASNPKEITILTLHVKVFFLHVYLWRAFIAFCCSSAVPNVK
jgi:hypothetical protein